VRGVEGSSAGDESACAAAVGCVDLMAFIAVGMSDVSSCIIDVQPGQHVGKGQELGYFQFGGSTHCLVFRPGVISDVIIRAVPLPGDPTAPLVLVNSALATATRA